MNSATLRSVLGAGVLLLVGRTAAGCSVTHVSTASEIVQQADVIVRAKAVSSTGRDEYSGTVSFEVLEVLKGQVDTRTLNLRGTVERYDGPNDGLPPYDFVRIGGRRGDCFAHDYKKDSEFLLFIQSSHVHWAPLAATNEEVRGPDDPWVWWVKGFLAGSQSSAQPQPRRGEPKPNPALQPTPQGRRG